jgi:hypothetical protein
MNTLWGAELSPGQFLSPFDEVVRELQEKGAALYECLRPKMRPQWRQRQLEVLIVDNPDFNAFAMEHNGHDRVCIFRGAIEKLYGNFLGMLSVPFFLPTVGDVSVEDMPDELLLGGFPSAPLLRSASAQNQSIPFYLPNDETRRLVATVLIELALEFLIYHELGHVLGGHLELMESKTGSSFISEFANAIATPQIAMMQQVMECDADAFACHLTAGVHLNDTVAESMKEALGKLNWPAADIAMFTYLAATGVLFRSCYPEAPARLDDSNSSHPHPAVRSCLVAASTMARAHSAGRFSLETLTPIVVDTIGNLETVWAQLCLPGQNPDPAPGWAKSVDKEAGALFQSFGSSRPLFEKHARIPRRWDDWQWPESQAPTQPMGNTEADEKAVIDSLLSGTPLSPEVADRVHERALRIREDIRRKHGLVDIAVPAIREFRGELPP